MRELTVFRCRAVPIGVLALAVWALPAHAVTYTVNGNLSDGGDCEAPPLEGDWDDGSDTCTLRQFDLAAADTLRIVNATVLAEGTLGLGPSFNHGTIDNEGTLVVSTALINQGSIVNGVGALLSSSASLRNHASIDNRGTFVNTSTGTLSNPGGSIGNNGTIENDGSIVNDVDGTINSVAGALFVNSNALSNLHDFHNDGRFVNGGPINNAGLFDNAGILDNDFMIFNSGGTIDIDAGGTFNNHGPLFNQLNSVLDNAGFIDNTDEIRNFATIDNTGTIDNAGRINNVCSGTIIGNGTINPIDNGVITNRLLWFTEVGPEIAWCGGPPDLVSYDIVRGDLSLLRSTRGDFRQSCDGCLGDDYAETVLDYEPIPEASEGWWFLVRGVTDEGVGTYDSASLSQIDERDAEIGASGLDCSQPMELLVGGALSHGVIRSEASNCSFVDAFVSSGAGGLSDPNGMAHGPDGRLYVASGNTDSVLRYDGSSGAFLDVFVGSASGGLDLPRGLVFGPDGGLYVASALSDSVLRYDGSSGAFIDAFVASGSGGLDDPYDLAFGPDGRLYVTDQLLNSVLRYDGTSGAFVDAFVAPPSGGLGDLFHLAFGADGHLYVSGRSNDLAAWKVLRYDGTTGAPLPAAGQPGAVFSNGATLGIAQDLAFGPQGLLHVTDFLGDSVLRFDGTTGALIDTCVPSQAGGLDGPRFLLFRPAPVLGP